MAQQSALSICCTLHLGHVDGEATPLTGKEGLCGHKRPVWLKIIMLCQTAFVRQSAYQSLYSLLHFCCVSSKTGKNEWPHFCCNPGGGKICTPMGIIGNYPQQTTFTDLYNSIIDGKFDDVGFPEYKDWNVTCHIGIYRCIHTIWLMA